MTSTIDFGAYTDFSKRAFAPVIRAQEAATKTLEQVAKYQYELAGDYLSYGIENLHATTKAKDPADLLSKQVELTSGFFDKLTKRSQEFTKLVSGAQASFAQLVEDAAAEAPVTVKGKKAA
jgi:phasin family protein